MSYAVSVGDRISTERELVVATCWCGIVFAIPANRERWMREKDTNSCYCPEGHSFHYSSNRRTALERELTAARDAAAQARAERDQAEASARGYKAAATRARKRHAAGICPACKRTFQNVQRHMASQHPDYKPEEGAT
jgi:septal ring factor EnvC (AmiA/AmiB activator)